MTEEIIVLADEFRRTRMQIRDLKQDIEENEKHVAYLKSEMAKWEEKLATLNEQWQKVSGSQITEPRG